MKIIFLELLKGLFLAACFLVFCLILATCSRSVYSNTVHPHGESSLVTSNHQSAHAAPIAVFLCVPFGYPPFMVRLNGDAFARASFFDDLSTNPFQLCHPHLVVNGKAPLDSNGAHSHA